MAGVGDVFVMVIRLGPAIVRRNNADRVALAGVAIASGRRLFLAKHGRTNVFEHGFRVGDPSIDYIAMHERQVAFD